MSHWCQVCCVGSSNSYKQTKALCPGSICSYKKSLQAPFDLGLYYGSFRNTSMIPSENRKSLGSGCEAPVPLGRRRRRRFVVFICCCVCFVWFSLFFTWFRIIIFSYVITAWSGNVLSNFPFPRIAVIVHVIPVKYALFLPPSILRIIFMLALSSMVFDSLYSFPFYTSYFLLFLPIFGLLRFLMLQSVTDFIFNLKFSF